LTSFAAYVDAILGLQIVSQGPMAAVARWWLEPGDDVVCPGMVLVCGDHINSNGPVVITVALWWSVWPGGDRTGPVVTVVARWW